jgi:hypothetical protein
MRFSDLRVETVISGISAGPAADLHTTSFDDLSRIAFEVERTLSADDS